MALLMRRLFVDAQAKLRRMVEEHTANLTSRIEPECPVVDPPSASLARCSPPDPSSLTNKPLSPNQDGTATPPIKKAVLSLPPPDLNTATDTSSVSDSITSFDVKCLTELKKNSFSTARPSSIESTKKLRDPIGTSSKSASFDSNDIEITKTIKSSEFKALKLSKCSSIDKSKSLDIASDEEEGAALLGHEDVDPETNSMCSESKNNRCLSPGKHEPKSNQSTPESRPDSPQPGCSYFQLYEIKNSLHSDSAVSSRKNNDDLLGTTATHNANILKSMRLENDRLQAEVTRLKRLVVSGVSKNEPSITEPGAPIDCSPAKVHALEIELQLAREAISALKSDRKRLKAEKFDLLSQMKQLYATLEDKEKELRDFIRSYEQMRDSETSLQQLTTEREERERERWSLLRHARDEAERSLSLAAQLNAKELQLQQAQEQLQEARRQLAANGCLSDQESLASLPRHSTNGGAMTPGSGGLISGQHVLSLGLLSGDRGSCSADSGVRVSSDRESGGATSAGGNLSDSTTDGTPTITIEGNNVDVDSISVVSSIVPHHMYPAISTPKDCSPTLSPLNANNFTRSIDSGVLSRSVEQLNSPLEAEPTSLVGRRIKAFHSRPGGSSRGGTWGSISRVFARSRHRNKSVNPTPENESAYDPYRSWSPLTEEGYAEKLRLLREAASVPMEKWRAPTVLAWIEIALGMPQYGARCAENVKSGKIRGLHGQVLLELSDLELECGLGISHPMHRKKLRLAIEEHRHPNLVRYPCISQLGHTWVSSEWLPDLGLAQYSENFATNMVDARMLDNLSKKELEKFLGVTRKFHQASIVHGIHLLRIMKYDRQALAVRRHQCETVDADPLVWTNQRFIRWARNIDLGEYADNLKDSGVHGGLVVLEPSFNGDTMATALGVPPSKNMIRRHLMTELEALVLPARSTLEHYIRVRGSGTKHRIPGGSLGRSYSKSCAGSLATSNPKPVATPTDNDSRRTSIRGSFGRALGFKKSDRDKHSPTSSSESSSIISRINTPPPHFRSLSNESPVYAIPFAFQHSSPYSNISSKTNETLYENPSTLNYLNNSSNSYDISDQKNSFDECLHLTKNQISHRRVKSISDADGLVSPT